MTDDPEQKMLALEKFNIAFTKFGQGLIEFKAALDESIKILEGTKVDKKYAI